ncbi:MAG: ABC transporter ATP-binding protein [bacterium]|nr:ABC transporter ATP-binding protein [bacterium]MDA1292390.1 ABC transporter ATP-binding protein [bacterium]
MPKKTKKTAAPLIETQNLHKSYFSEELETAVLHGINLTIHEEEFISIMGPSGSGKSTLMHILGFLDQPTQGKYLFRGEPTRTMTDDELAAIRATRVSFVFQAFNLLPRTSVLDNVMLPLLYHPTIPASERIDRSMEAIRAVDLTDRALYYTNQLSGGQQQRVAIARALVTDPDVIFADEPTGNLDSTSGNQVMEVLQNLHEQGGRTIILVTHEQSTAAHAKRIIHLKDGLVDSDVQSFKRISAKTNNTLEK